MPDTPPLRIIDASLNRAGEGLRVVEDYVRFVLDDPLLSSQIKSLRHDFAAAAIMIPAEERYAARDTSHDVGTELSTHSEQNRSDTWAVCAASLKRTEQSLRSLEEYGKLIDGGFARQMETLRYRLYTLEKTLDIGQTSRERLEGVNLCVLVDGRKSAAAFERLVAELVEAGVGIFNYGIKGSMTVSYSVAGGDCGSSRRGTASLAIINDRADIAAASDADGVHLGQEDLTVKDARAVVGTQMLIGVSTHNIDQARAAVLDGANYLGAGPTFASQTKSFAEFAGLDYLRQVAAEIRLPTFAIGGVKKENLSDVLAAGITRIAVSGAIIDADKPACAAKELLGMLDVTGC